MHLYGANGGVVNSRKYKNMHLYGANGGNQLAAARRRIMVAHVDPAMQQLHSYPLKNFHIIRNFYFLPTKEFPH